MKWASGIAVLGLVVLVAVGTWSLFPRPDVPPWEEETAAWGAENAVAAIVLGARLWDTLFEILVYAMTMVGVRLALRPLRRTEPQAPLPETPFLRRAADVLLGPIVVFAMYLTASGHLGPGGGFPAGALLGSGLLLLALAKGADRLGGELHEPVLERGEYGAIVAILALGWVLLLVGRRGSGYLIAANVLIALEVGIGAWVVLHRFASSRGEV
jgi:multicomponent Na+:H+ antiporter subunit B